MSFGVTDEGFVIKRLTDIKEEIENSLRSALGNSINLLPTELLGQMVGIFSEREALIWELAHDVYNSQYPDTANGSSLDNVMALTAVERLEATKSTVSGTAYGTEGTVIAEGAIVSVDGDPDAQFEMDNEYTIGAGTDEIQTITFSAVPDAGSFTLIFDGDETTDIDFSDADSDVQSALNALTSLSSVVVTGNFTDGFTITFTGTDGEQDQELFVEGSNSLENTGSPVDITITETTPGVLPNVTCELSAVAAGSVQASAGTLTVIETVIAGWDTFENEEDADVGKDEETDAESRVRREETLAAAGTTTIPAIRASLLEIDEVEAAVVYENNTAIEDEDGRPPKSIECVVLGGEDDDIFDTIWDSKPGGIELFGSVEGTITDSQGFLQTIKFNRPTEIDIYLEIDIETDGEFPVDGEDAIVQEILDYTSGEFGIGQDVITTRLYCPINEVDGITDITIRIGTSASPLANDNITIEADEISSWDSGRITVTVV